MIFNNNLTLYNATDEPPVLIFNNTNLINFYSNCCHAVTTPTSTTEPNFTEYLAELPSDRVSLLIFLLLFSFSTVFGNSLVILAVIRERYLHTSTNYFVTSLAVADCLVGFVVMPFSALYEVLQNTWFFGEDWCDTWRSLDVLFSTASILNLCVISLDRYWAITDPFSYPMKMTRNRAVVLIAAVWICSSLISFPAIVFWRAVRHGSMPEYKCTFTEHLGYLVFSSTISFYLPLLVMVFTYCRIYRAAAEQTKSLKLGTKQVLMTSGEMQLTLRIHRGGTTREGHHHQTTQNTANSTPEEPDDEPLSALHNNGIRHRHLGKNFSLSRKLAKFAKEKKAAKTLGIVMGMLILFVLSRHARSRIEYWVERPADRFLIKIGFGSRWLSHESLLDITLIWKHLSVVPIISLYSTPTCLIGWKWYGAGSTSGVFIVCWLPFFVVNLLTGLCEDCIAHEEIVSAVVTWLGWINSSMKREPFLYNAPIKTHAATYRIKLSGSEFPQDPTNSPFYSPRHESGHLCLLESRLSKVSWLFVDECQHNYIRPD